MERLNRRAVDLGTPPERIVHLGLGAFHRAHQAWYTAHASDADRWGIVAFTGRSRDLADRLAAQDGLYTLIRRDPDADRYEVIPSIVRAEAGDDVGAFVAALSRSEVAILTLTITEAGYHISRDGGLDLADAAVATDLGLLRDAVRSSRMDASAAASSPRTALARILLGLSARRRENGGPIALVSCDNLPDNGGALRRALLELATAVSPDVHRWIRDSVSFVSTSVDRITPAIDAVAESRAVARETGWVDAAPVVTEAFSDWVLCGDFPAGRPDWGAAGARFVEDLAPWENRKLWTLNGAHTVLAAFGQARGHLTVSEAIDDPVCRQVVDALWDDIALRLPTLDLTGYRVALIERFRNRRIQHRLAQIALDCTTKMRLRIVPVAVGERAEGRPAEGCAAAIAAWMLGVGAGVVESPVAYTPLGRAPGRAAQTQLLNVLDPRLASDADFAARVAHAVARLAAAREPLSPSREGDQHP